MTPGFQHFAEVIMPQTKVQAAVDAANSVTAAGAIAAPYWFPLLKNGSEWVAAILPYMGLILVALQIIYYVRRNRRLRP
jgi:hypothetical protein